MSIYLVYSDIPRAGQAYSVTKIQITMAWILNIWCFAPQWLLAEWNQFVIKTMKTFQRVIGCIETVNKSEQQNFRINKRRKTIVPTNPVR